MAPRTRRRRGVPPRKQVDYETLNHQDEGRPSRFRYSASSLVPMRRMWYRWTEFCVAFDLSPTKPLTARSLRTIKDFIHWHINHSDIRLLSTAYGDLRHWRSAYKQKHGKGLDDALISEMTHYIKVDICLDFELSEKRSDKGVMNVDDLFFLLHHHWVVDASYYPTERQRIQLGLVLLLMAYTGVRPAGVLETYRGRTREEAGKDDDPDLLISDKDPDSRPDSLKYKDIQLFKVRDPNGQHVLMMIVTFRLMKNSRNKGLPPRFVFHERDDNLVFCAILYVLSLAFADQAFKSRWLREPADLFAFEVDKERGLLGVPLEWKEEKLEVPILRRAEPSVDGYTTSAQKAWRYDDARNPALRLGKAVGLKDPFHFYELRRGAGEAIDDCATEAVRNRALGHSRGQIFSKYYVNQIIGTDTVSAFLGTPLTDWAIRLGSHLSLTRDPFAEQSIAPPSAEEVCADTGVRALLEQVEALKRSLTQTYGSIQAAAARKSPESKRYSECSKNLRTLKLRVSRQMYGERWKAWFANLGTNEIERQRTAQRGPQRPPTGDFEILERRRLAPLLCRNDDVATLSETEVDGRRVEALTAMTALCRRRPGLHHQARQRTPEHLHDPEDDPTTGVGKEGGDLYGAQQCPWCFYDETLAPSQRIFRYAKLKNLRHHIENTHLQHARTATEPPSVDPQDIYMWPPLRCPFARCPERAPSEEFLKHHLAVQHGFFCERCPKNDLDRIQHGSTEDIQPSPPAGGFGFIDFEATSSLVRARSDGTWASSPL